MRVIVHEVADMVSDDDDSGDTDEGKEVDQGIDEV